MPANPGPALHHRIKQLRDGLIDAVVGTEVERLAIERRLCEQTGPEPQIAAQWLEYVLPWARRPGAAHADRLPARPGADAVGNDALRGPVPAADYVTGPRYRHARRGVFEEGVKIGISDQIRAALGPAVRIASAEGVGLPVAPTPFVVSVGL